MDRKKFRFKAWFWIPILFLIFLASSFIAIGQPPREYPPYVSHSPSPTGIKALYTYLEEERDKVQRWERPPDQLPVHEQNRALLMIEPAFVPTGNEMVQYEAFMEAGNTIVLFSENPAGMFGLRYDPSSRFLEDEPIYWGEETYFAQQRSPLRLVPADEDEILLEDELGVVAFKREFGEGALMVVNEPYWLMNQFILDEDHIPLILTLIEEANADELWFDEYVHGEDNSTSMLAVYPLWFIILMLQLGVFTLLWLLYQGKRFGPILVEREETVRFSDEALHALSAWFIKGKHYSGALQIQNDYVRTRMQEKWGIPLTKEWTDIADNLMQKWDEKTEKETRTFVYELEGVLRKETVSKQEYLLWAKKLNELQKGVEKR
ncbi:DUF4350 domain-containing protein [Halalkalibacter hemicellulosilyticus]|uniref:DUF4350 domain-containing protein n=1 Tax=Halalkalibacter hemicellulosilyticusJCM 9152 TaxID=1236971 RepID=W4QEA7_9BACI|nr:DUF4350 domain-containing protein [Halalkalibacter hemicellulosilyticus]GAE29694.1 hypothetical protein JCM9152_1069 [Halalkalibacter hemicellulosilyticusJCM 9152]